MSYRVKGTLKLPDGSPASNAEIEFISRKNYSPLVRELKSNMLCGPTGAYDVTLEFGEYAVMVYPGGTYPAALGTITLASDTAAGQDLPTLLQQSGWQPATPEYIQQIAAWLAEANASATAAKASQDAAKVSETNAAASASTVAGAIATHEGKAGAHTISGVTGLQAALDGKYSPTNKPTAADIQNVVSSVSSGGIIERGSNANGGYTKFADGRMICTGMRAQTWVPISRYAFNLPASFTSLDNAVSVSTIPTQGSYSALGFLDGPEVISLSTTEAHSQKIFFTVVGLWK